MVYCNTKTQYIVSAFYAGNKIGHSCRVQNAQQIPSKKPPTQKGKRYKICWHLLHQAFKRHCASPVSGVKLRRDFASCARSIVQQVCAGPFTFGLIGYCDSSGFARSVGHGSTVHRYHSHRDNQKKNRLFLLTHNANEFPGFKRQVSSWPESPTVAWSYFQI